MRRLINLERMERGKRRLDPKAWLQRNARKYSAKMAAADEWLHNPWLAQQLGSRPWHTLGENAGHAGTVLLDAPHSSVHRTTSSTAASIAWGSGSCGATGILWFTQVFAG